MFVMPPLDHEQLHGMSLGIPYIDNLIYKRKPVVGKLFTNDDGETLDWVLSQDGEMASTRLCQNHGLHTCSVANLPKKAPRTTLALTKATVYPFQRGIRFQSVRMVSLVINAANRLIWWTNYTAGCSAGAVTSSSRRDQPSCPGQVPGQL